MFWMEFGTSVRNQGFSQEVHISNLELLSKLELLLGHLLYLPLKYQLTET